jgi:hypothetical protein
MRQSRPRKFSSSLTYMRDEAIAALGRAIKLGFVHYPFFESLRGDPEFMEFMQQAKAEWEYFGSQPIPAVEG